MSKNIVEPTGGIDGMPIHKAMAWAANGKKVRRAGWKNKDAMVAWSSANGFTISDKTLDYYRGFVADLADYVSCDWYVVEDK